MRLRGSLGLLSGNPSAVSGAVAGSATDALLMPVPPRPHPVELRDDAQQRFLIANAVVSEEHGSRICGQDVHGPAVAMHEVHQRTHAEQGNATYCGCAERRGASG